MHAPSSNAFAPAFPVASCPANWQAHGAACVLVGPQISVHASTSLLARAPQLFFSAHASAAMAPRTPGKVLPKGSRQGSRPLSEAWGDGDATSPAPATRECATTAGGGGAAFHHSSSTGASTSSGASSSIGRALSGCRVTAWWYFFCCSCQLACYTGTPACRAQGGTKACAAAGSRACAGA